MGGASRGIPDFGVPKQSLNRDTWMVVKSSELIKKEHRSMRGRELEQSLAAHIALLYTVSGS